MSTAPAPASTDGCSCSKQNRSAERQQWPGSPRQRIDDGEIAGPVAAEQALRVQQMQDTGGEQKEERPTDRRLDHDLRQNPNREGREQQQLPSLKKTR